MSELIKKEKIVTWKPSVRPIEGSESMFKVKIESIRDGGITVIEGDFHKSEIDHFIQYMDRKTGTGL